MQLEIPLLLLLTVMSDFHGNQDRVLIPNGSFLSYAYF